MRFVCLGPSRHLFKKCLCFLRCVNSFHFDNHHRSESRSTEIINIQSFFKAFFFWVTSMQAHLSIGAVLGGDITLLSGTATVGGAEIQRLPQHSGNANALCLVPASSFGAPKDAELIASGGDDRRILIWNLATMAAHHRIDTSGAVCSMSVIGDAYLAAGVGSTIFLHDVSDGRCVRTLTGHTNPISSIVDVSRLMASPQRVFVTGSWDRSLRCWVADDGRCVDVAASAHSACIKCVSIWHGHLISGGDDRVLKMWTGPSMGAIGRVKCSAVTDSEIECMQPSDEYLFCGHEDGSVTTWRNELIWHRHIDRVCGGELIRSMSLFGSFVLAVGRYDATDGRHNLRIIDMSGAEPTTHVRRIPFQQRGHWLCSLLSLRDGVAMSVGDSPSNIYVMRFRLIEPLTEMPLEPRTQKRCPCVWNESAYSKPTCLNDESILITVRDASRLEPKSRAIFGLV